VTATKTSSRVLSVSFLTPQTFVLRFERHGLVFEPGQYLSVGLWGQREQREYSIFSPTSAPWFEILVKVVENGKVSRELAKLQPGEELSVDGPFGYFRIEPEHRDLPLLFLATGTGISPFRCFVNSYANLDYTLLHGIRRASEQYAYDQFSRPRIISCVSGAPEGDFSGRVTAFLESFALKPETQAFLCGNCDMIYNAFDLLRAKGVASSQIFTEVYF
jgi:ferredoxin--NADP+ reductase/benzoate/toluate 1,2-dioxygenase reductase subunit